MEIEAAFSPQPDSRPFRVVIRLVVAATGVVVASGAISF